MAQEIQKQEAIGGSASRYRDPFIEMRAEMDRIFDNFLGPTFFGRRPLVSRSEPSGIGAPIVDIRENDKEFVFEAELPGIGEKDVQVTLRNGVLSLKGEKRSKRDEKRDTYHLVERNYGSFERSFRLPDSADEEKIAADFNNGVLRIVVPKRAEAIRTDKSIPIGKG
jgi:HSP20 family protein